MSGDNQVSSRTDEKYALTYTLGSRILKMPKSRIPELIDKARDSGLSFRDIRRRAGDQIPLSTLNALHKNRPPNPNLTTETILALAKGLGESPTVVFDALIGKVSTGIRDESLRQFCEDFTKLPARDREELRPMIEMLTTEVQKRLDRDA